MLRVLLQSLKLVVILVVGLLVFAGARQLFDTLGRTDRVQPEAVAIVVKAGDGPAEVSKTLEEKKVIQSGFMFRALVRIRNAGGKFTAGEHHVVRGMSMNQLIDVLTTPPKIDEVTVTFQEGLRLEEYAALLKKHGLIETDEAFINATREDYDYAFLRSRPAGVGLEGYLFPDTYRFVKGAKPRDIIVRMLDNFDRKVTAEMRAQADAQKRTIHQVLTLASIVEREAQKPEERAKVAGVYVNRLERDMPLQADPTVQYAIGKPDNWWPRDTVLANGLRQAGPYNTYMMVGLPPGPIANPGLESIKAALQPEKHDFIYFVAKGDGFHEFARTLDEHNANVRRYTR